MKKVLLVMHRIMIAELLKKELSRSDRFDVSVECDINGALLLEAQKGSDIIILELPERQKQRATEYLAYCEKFKELHNHQKILVICPETDLDACEAVIEAKRSGRIDDFVFL